MIWDDFKEVYDLLEDDLSKKIYESRVKWYFYGGEDNLEKELYKHYKSSRVVGLDEYTEDTSYAICGAGFLGNKTLLALTHAGYKVCAFIDNNKEKQGKDIEGIRIYSVSDFVNKFKDKNVTVIIDNLRISNIFFSELYDMGWNQKKIFQTKDNVVRTAFGDIYFDLPELKHEQDEVFMDAGSFDGETTRDFLRWCNNMYEKIYVLEPMYDAYVLLQENLKNIENIDIKRKALGKEKGKEYFAESYTGLMGSRLGNQGDYIETVDVDTIDNILNGSRVTFIKFDIEGAELDALKGGINTLQKYRPKLAISLYHKREDLINIPLWVKKNVPGYKFYLRQYSNKLWDLVLYCV